MKVVYASSACSKRRFFELFPSKWRMPGQQVQKYHRLMLEGLSRNGIAVIALTTPPITRQNHRAGVSKVQPDNEEGVDYRYLTVLNYPVIKNIANFMQSFAKTCGYLHSSKDAVVICDVLNFSVATGALLAAKLFRRTNTGIVTDIPSLLSKNPNPLITWAITFAMIRYDSYVFLTREMDSLINRRGVPFVVIEGQVDINMRDRPNETTLKHRERVCLYAGAVDKRYGLEALVLGFLKTQTPDCELHIYGSGDYAQTLIGIAQGESRVKYLGPVLNDRVIAEQLRATLLINPRPTTEEFTKYSFPSKNMEYMASGTPLLTTLLPGMPEEYLPYVYVLRDESPEGIAAELDTVLALDSRQLHCKGKEAKEFALKRKNNVIQAGRVAELIASCQGSNAAGNS
jgi:glycosyltransferase involved in cell wall biosynthesis